MPAIRIRSTLALAVTLAMWAGDIVEAQVYQTFRHEARANPQQRRSIHAGAVAIGRPGGRRSGRHYSGGPNIVIPGPVVQRPASPTWSSSRYRVYGHGPSRGYIRRYSTAPGPIRYSIQSEAGRFPTQYGTIQPFPFGAPIIDPYHPQVIAPTIIAPPVVLPYGGFAPTFGTGRSIVDYREVPPAPSVIPQALQSVQPAAPAPIPLQNGEPLSRRIPTDQLPLINEFPAAIETRPTAAAVDRIRSLRYQTSGDGAFRGGDFTTAEVFYTTAVETAPRKQSAWLRLVWAQVAQSRYAEATATLKTALRIQDDPTATLVTARDLYGTRLAARGLLLTDGLWRWVEQRPQSTDRLLLAAAFYQMTEQPVAVKDILNEAASMGLDSELLESLQKLNPEAAAIDDRQPRAEPLPLTIPPGAAGPRPEASGPPLRPAPASPNKNVDPANVITDPAELSEPSALGVPFDTPGAADSEFVPLPPVADPALPSVPLPPAEITSEDIPTP